MYFVVVYLFSCITFILSATSPECQIKTGPLINPFTTEARFYVLNAIAFSTWKRASVVKGLSI